MRSYATPSPSEPMQSLTMNYQLCVPALLRRARQHFGDKTIVSRRGDGGLYKTTFAVLLERSARLAGALRALGVGRSDLVATLCWNHDRHLEAYYAVPGMGAVLHTLNLRLTAEELAFIAADAGDRVLLVDEELLPLALATHARRAFEQVVVIRSTDMELPAGVLDYESLIDGATPVDLEAEIPEWEPAAMCYTSGTTGRPKGVVYAHRAIALHSMTIGVADSFGVSERDVVLPVVPMFHANAWGLPFAAALHGASLVLPGRQLDPRSLRGLLASEGVTFTAGVPTVWTALLQLLDSEPGAADLSRLRLMLVGGAAVPPSLVQGFGERHGIEILHAWGMTELAPIGTQARVPSRLRDTSAAEQLRYRCTQGTPAPFVEVRGRNEAGPLCWDGSAMGELEVRGAWVASGYHGHGPGGDCFTEDDWFRTGDVVAIDSFGGIEIRDRAKDLVKSGGEWISSVALENHLMGHPAVLEAAVIAVPHPTWQERPLAAVVLRPGASADAEMLRAHLAASFPKWWLPEGIVFLEVLPRTSTGKFLKLALRERYSGWFSTAEP